MSVGAGRALSGRRKRIAAPAGALPWYGLLIFTFCFVTARLPELFTEIGIYLALLGLVFHPQGVSFPPPLRWALVFILWASVTGLLAISPHEAWPVLIERLKALVIFFVVVNAVRTPQQLRLYILVILLAFVIYPARGSLLNYVTGNTLFGRAIWNKMYNNPNDLGAIALLMLGFSLAVATVKTQDLRVRRAAGVLVPVTLLIILLTQSRGVFLGLLIGFGPPLLARFRKGPSGLAPALLVLAVVALLVPATAWHRLHGITELTSVDSGAETEQQHQPPVAGNKFDQVAFNSAQQRFEILKTGWQIFTDNPLTGVGIGCYNVANALYAPELGAKDAHNTYIHLAAEMGVPGLVLWLGLVGSVLSRVRRLRPRLQADDSTIQVVWIERAFIGYLVACIFASYSGLTMVYLFLGTLWAATNVLGRDAPATAPVAPVRRALRAR